jgi:hypothetical protein
MSQTHAVSLPSRSRIHWIAPLVLVTLVLALVTLAIVQGGGDQVADKPAAGSTAIRYGDFNPATGRPQAAPLPQSSQPTLSTARPDESAVAAAVGGNQGAQDVARPDESAVAAAVGGAQEGPTPFGGRR